MTTPLRFLLLGHPVAHSVSPAMCAAGFAALGLPHTYAAVDVPDPAGLRPFVDDLRHGAIGGCNVTVPHKRAAFDLADARAPSAEEVGVANVLARDASGQVVAHNTDVEALAADIAALASVRVTTRPPGPPMPPGPAGPSRRRAAIIGSGGAALAALIACRRLGFEVVSMTSRSWTDTQALLASPSAQRARALGALVAPWPRKDAAVPGGNLTEALRAQWGALSANADCVVQATSAGMHGADPGEEVAQVVTWDALPDHAVAYDVVYNPRVTPFVEAARRRGLGAASGLGMLVRQAALAIGLWTGLTPPLDRLREAAERALDAGWPT